MVLGLLTLSERIFSAVSFFTSNRVKNVSFDSGIIGGLRIYNSLFTSYSIMSNGLKLPMHRKVFSVSKMVVFPLPFSPAKTIVEKG